MQANQTAESRREMLRMIYDALSEQNYDPIRQLSGYILSNDPTYIPDHKNARTMIAEIAPADLLHDLLSNYLNSEGKAVSP